MTPEEEKPYRAPLPVEVLCSILAWPVLICVTIFFTLVSFLVFVVHKWVDPDLEWCHRIAATWGRTMVRLNPFLRVKVTGLENIPKDQPVILIANHQSYSDIPVLYFLYHSFKWMANDVLFRYPFMGWSMRMAGYIPVRRGNRQAVLKTAQQVRHWLERGISIFMFPEGTRSRVGVFGKFHVGGFRLSVTTQTPIVPVVLFGTRQLLPRGGWIFQMGGRPQIHVLPPVTPSSKDLKEVRTLARDVRVAMIRVYREKLREARRNA